MMSAAVIRSEIAEAEDHRAGLDERQVAGGDGVDHQLGDAGIVEDRLDDDDAADQIGQRKRDGIDDRAERVRQGVAAARCAGARRP